LFRLIGFSTRGRLLLYSTFEAHRHDSARVNKREEAGGDQEKKARLDEGSRKWGERKNKDKKEARKAEEGGKKRKEVRESVPEMNI